MARWQDGPYSGMHKIVDAQVQAWYDKQMRNRIGTALQPGPLKVVISSYRPKRNPLNGLDRVFRNAARDTLNQCADEICDIERHLLEHNNHINTGALYDSIRHSDALYRKERVSVKGYADAKNDGTMYEEFIEHGSGKYRDDGTGRQTPWVYFVKSGSVKLLDVKHPNRASLTSGGWLSQETIDRENRLLYLNYGALKTTRTTKGKHNNAQVKWNNRTKFIRQYKTYDKMTNTNVDQGQFITTEGMEPDPFIKPALDEVIPELMKRFRTNVDMQLKTKKYGIRHK